MLDAAASRQDALPDNSTLHDAPSSRPVSATPSDIALADAVASVVRSAPGVIDLSDGTMAIAATYGVGRHVTGVVVRHLSPEQMEVEIHVVLNQATCDQLASDTHEDADSQVTVGILTRVAAGIRSMAHDTLRDIGEMAPLEIDVLIDDLR